MKHTVVSARHVVVNSTFRWLVIVVQSSRLHSLVGTVDLAQMRVSTKATVSGGYMGASSLQAGWTAMVPTSETQHYSFQHIFSRKDTSCSSGVLHAPTTAQWSYLALYPQTGEPKSFVWLSGNSYMIGKLNQSAESVRDILVEEKSVSLPRVEGRLETAVGVSLSEWHALFAFPTRLAAVSLYTQAVVYEDKWDAEIGLVAGLTTDASSEFHWAFTSSHTFKYRPNDEARYVWRILLERGEYTRAVAVARNRMGTDPAAYEHVLRRQAEKHLQDGKYIAAAEILAFSSEPFETIVLRFLSSEDGPRAGLKTLLEKKLDQFQRPEDKIKRDALVMWLLEVQLQELAEHRRHGKVESERSRELTRQIHTFLNRKIVMDFVASNKDAVYKLVVSHADFDTQLYLANSLKDWDTVVNVHILREQYSEALHVIKKQGNPDLYYKYAPSLVTNLPRELFHSLKGLLRVRPSRMLPTLVQCQSDPKLAVEAMPYVEWAVSTPAGAADVSLRNLLIVMYARFRPNSLLAHLESMGRDKNSLPYDLEFAIRTCQQCRLDNCTVFLYCVADLFTEAVDIALKVDLNLAKNCATWMDISEDDLFAEPKYPEEARRRVWLSIGWELESATDVISTTGDASAVIGLLKESHEVIKIQDILPFFPNFTKIQHFKEPLCECLKEHSKKIQDLQSAMREATQTASEIRERTDKLKKRVCVVRASEICSSCERALLGRPFFAHACRHFFHRDCLERIVRRTLSKDTRTRLDELVRLEQRLLESLAVDDTKGLGGGSVAEKEQRLATVSGQISSLLGSDCPLCGIQAIEQINCSLFDEDEYEEDAITWRAQ